MCQTSATGRRHLLGSQIDPWVSSTVSQDLQLIDPVGAKISQFRPSRASRVQPQRSLCHHSRQADI